MTQEDSAAQRLRLIDAVSNSEPIIRTEMESAEVWRLPRVKLAARTSAAGRTGKNQDGLLVLPDSGLVFISDGIGGARSGDKATRMLLDQLAQLREQTINPDKISEKIASTVAELQKARVSNPNDFQENTGAVLIGARVDGDSLEVYQTGDATAKKYNFFRDDKNQIVYENGFPQVQNIFATTPEENDKGVVINAITGNPTVRCDLTHQRWNIQIGDRVIVASDGLWDALTITDEDGNKIDDPIIAEILAEAETAENATNALFELAQERMQQWQAEQARYKKAHGEWEVSGKIGPEPSVDTSLKVKSDNITVAVMFIDHLDGVGGIADAVDSVVEKAPALIEPIRNPQGQEIPKITEYPAKLTLSLTKHYTIGRQSLENPSMPEDPEKGRFDLPSRNNSYMSRDQATIYLGLNTDDSLDTNVYLSVKNTGKNPMKVWSSSAMNSEELLHKGEKRLLKNQSLIIFPGMPAGKAYQFISNGVEKALILVDVQN